MGRRMYLSRGLMAVVLAAGLSACSSENTKTSALSTATDALVTSIKARRDPPPKPLNITQPLLDRTKEGVLLVHSEQLGAPSLLRRVARRHDGHRGTAEVWQASDGAQVILRDGVLISTRGIGGDIASSDVGQVVHRLSTLSAGPSQRVVTLRRGDHVAVPVTMSCQISDLGAEAVTLVETPITLRRFRESCPSDAGMIVNDYWIDPATRLIRKSRQWAGPTVQYYGITLLKN